MPANVDAMVRAGVEAFRAGNKTEARTLLEKALEADEYNEPAWLWLSAVVDTPEEQRTCLENVLVINPKNERARMGLKSLGVDPDAVAPASPAAAPASPFTDNSFIADNASPSPFAADPDEWDEELPPTASSSASSTGFQADQASPTEYDSWIDSMNIGNKKGGGVAGPFGAPELEIEDSGLFGDDEFEDDPDPQAVPAVALARKSSAAPSFDEVEEEADDEDEDFLSSEVMAEFDAALDDESEATLDDLFNDKDLAGMPDIRVTAEYSTASGGDVDPGTLFAQIPPEIRAASRMPGESESSPRLLVIAAVLLVLVNIGGAAFLVSQLA